MARSAAAATAPPRHIAVAQPARVGTLQAQSPRLCFAARTSARCSSSACSRSCSPTSDRWSRATRANGSFRSSTTRPRRASAVISRRPPTGTTRSSSQQFARRRQFRGVHAQRIRRRTRSTITLARRTRSPPVKGHWLGTDSSGRDIVAQAALRLPRQHLFRPRAHVRRHGARHPDRRRCRATSAAASTSPRSASSRSGAPYRSCTC